MASDDMKDAGKAVIEKADKAIDRIGEKMDDLVDKGVKFVKKE